MKALLFVGPSLPALHRLELPDIEVRGPAAQGDLYRAACRRPRAIGLVDGVFGSEPAVWHKEILFALETGVPVSGAASMGALRAAELHRFGMTGIGTIFAAFRDGLLDADDEVALLHGPAELGWPALSEPLVNLRATLARLERTGLIGRMEALEVVGRVGALFYPERTRAAFEGVLAQIVGPQRGDTVVRWSRRLWIDAKRADAARLVRHLRRLHGEPARPRFRLSRTGPFRHLQRACAAAERCAPVATPSRGARRSGGTPPEGSGSVIACTASR